MLALIDEQCAHTKCTEPVAHTSGRVASAVFQTNKQSHVTFKSAQAEEDMEEQLRWFAEGCDRLEGFHALAHPCDHFTGTSTATLDALRDAYPKTAVLLFSVAQDSAQLAPAQSGFGAVERNLTAALAAARWATACSLRVPLHSCESTPHLQLDPANVYHASALYGAAIDTCTLPYRLYPGQAPAQADGRAQQQSGPPSHGACAMADLCSTLAFPGASLAALSCTLPANSAPVTADVSQDARLSARERRLQGLAAEAAPAVPAELVAEGLHWLSGVSDPLAGACFAAEHTCEMCCG